jgi:hypothetical protein
MNDDVLLATKHEAARREVSLGEAASDLICAGLKAGAQRQTKPAATVGPFALLSARVKIVTPEHVRRLMKRRGDT